MSVKSKYIIFLFLSFCTLTAYGCNTSHDTNQTSVQISNIALAKDSSFTGRGNDNEVIVRAVAYLNSSSSVTCKSITINMNGTTDLNDVSSIKIYTTGSSPNFDSRNVSNATLLGTSTPAAGDIVCKTNGKFSPGINYLYLTYKIQDNAKEGNTVGGSLLSLTTETQTIAAATQPSGNRTILLARKLIFAPGDYGSSNYRIPAINTAADGSLVVLTDKRKTGSGDLPADIDIVCRRSADGGKNWSDPVTVAQGTGYGKGFGDAVLVKAKSGKLIALFVGGLGLSASTPSNSNHTYVSTSSNNGISWTTPVDITSQIFGTGCSDPVRATWYASFCGSGHGLCTRSGRVMVVAAVRETSGGSLNNYALYSDDEGSTWKTSGLAITGGDEAKVVELNNGNILMSSRTTGNRYYSVSTDGGVTWGPRNTWSEIWGNACDADIVRYTSTLDGYDKNRLLHTLPNASSRQNVSMWISYDEGTTWPYKRTLCPGTSAYSSITILPDGTIGVYLEEDESVPYKMYYMNFSLNWFTKSADVYSAPK